MDDKSKKKVVAGIAGGIEGADDGAGAGADHHVRHDAVGFQGLDHPHMGKAPGGAAPQGQHHLGRRMAHRRRNRCRGLRPVQGDAAAKQQGSGPQEGAKAGTTGRIHGGLAEFSRALARGKGHIIMSPTPACPSTFASG